MDHLTDLRNLTKEISDLPSTYFVCRPLAENKILLNRDLLRETSYNVLSAGRALSEISEDFQTREKIMFVTLQAGRLLSMDMKLTLGTSNGCGMRDLLKSVSSRLTNLKTDLASLEKVPVPVAQL